MTSIVFSKDRAMQLNAFLRSYRDHLIPLGTIHVLYLATTARHAAAYDEVFLIHDFAVPHALTELKQDLLKVVPSTGNVIFFVDDQVFIRPWRVLETPGLSLRLAPHLTHCYTMNVEQPLPEFRPYVAGLRSWQWSEGLYDWGYPLSVDGHVFDAEEMRGLIERVDFHSPNTLERALQQFAPQFAERQGLCYTESKVVNIPWNLVQEDWFNRHEATMTPDGFLGLWEEGLEVDVQAIYGIINKSVHQGFPLVLVSR